MKISWSYSEVECLFFVWVRWLVETWFSFFCLLVNLAIYFLYKNKILAFQFYYSSTLGHLAGHGFLPIMRKRCPLIPVQCMYYDIIHHSN
jgi:hypothetical protein